MNKFFPKFLLYLSIIILAYSIFRSEIINEGNFRNYYYKFYFISLVLFLISLIFTYLSKPFKLYFLIIFISTIFSLYLFEAYLTFFLGENNILKKIRILKKEERKYDTRSRFELIKDLNDKEVTINYHPSYMLKEKTDIFPLSGVSKIKTISCNESGYYSSYVSDRYGFNNPDKEWNKETIDYLLLGDSFIHGDCVNRPNDVSSILRKITGKSIINVASRGNGPLINYAALREYYNPKIKNVLWFVYVGNDPWELTEELENSLLKKYLSDDSFSQNLKSQQNLINEKLKQIFEREIKKEEAFFNINNSLKTKFLKFMKLFNLRYKFENKNVGIKFPEELLQIFEKAKFELSSNNSKLTIVLLPPYFKKDLRDIDLYNYKKVIEISKQLGIETIDLFEKFKKISDREKFFPFGLPGHYNVDGYRFISQEISKNLR